MVCDKSLLLLVTATVGSTSWAGLTDVWAKSFSALTPTVAPKTNHHKGHTIAPSVVASWTPPRTGHPPAGFCVCGHNIGSGPDLSGPITSYWVVIVMLVIVVLVIGSVIGSIRV